jgi:hypothetical protein
MGVDSIGSDALAGGGLIRSYGGWEVVSKLRQEHIRCIGDERILGDTSFVEQALAQDEIAIEQSSKLEQDGWDLDKLIILVCSTCGIAEAEILKKSRAQPVSRAKALICFLSTDKLGISSRELSNRLLISQPAVSKWVSKGRVINEAENSFLLMS